MHRVTLMPQIITLLLAIASGEAWSQPASKMPRVPVGMPSSLVSAVPRIFQVYGSVEDLFHDSVSVVDANGVSQRRDTLVRRTQFSSLAPCNRGDADTIFSFTTIGLLAIDAPRTTGELPAPFTGREELTGVVVELRRLLGFWQPLDSLTSTFSSDSVQEGGANQAQIEIYPNPFASSLRVRFGNETGRVAGSRVYTLDGRPVAYLVQVRTTPTLTEWSWDGVCDDGFTVPAGVYLVQILLEHADHTNWRIKSTPVIKLP